MSSETDKEEVSLVPFSSPCSPEPNVYHTPSIIFTRYHPFLKLLGDQTALM